MQRVTIDPESELGRQLKAAAAERPPLRLVSGSTIYEVQAHEMAPRPGSDPARVRQGLARSAGALRGIDLTVLKQELRDAREQESHGRPA